jgi:hypothetical protein
MTSERSNRQSAGRFFLVVTLPDGKKDQYELAAREISIGRDPSNHIQLSHHFVSQFHAKFVRTGSSCSLVDLGSANKTRVNGREIVQKELKNGDEIEFASIKCRLVLEEGSSGGLTASIGKSGVCEEAPKGRESDVPPLETPISKAYLSMGVVLLFSVVVALATQVC